MKGSIKFYKSERRKRDTMNEKDEQKRRDELIIRARMVNEAIVRCEIAKVYNIAINKIYEDEYL